MLDYESRESLATWPLPPPLAGNFPMHLDEACGALYVGCRKPGASACVLVFDTATGAERGRD